MRAVARRRLVALVAAVIAVSGTTGVAFALSMGASQPALASLQGELLVAHGTSVNGGPMVMQTAVRTSSGVVPLNVPTSQRTRIMELAGDRVKVRGTRHGRSFSAAALSSAGGGATAQGASVAGAPRPMRIALVLMHLPGSTLEPVSKASAQANLASVINWYSEVSGGQVAATGTVYGYEDGGTSSCDLWTQQTAAAAAAAKDGYVASNYDHIVVYTPGNSCGFAGIAWVGANGVYLNGTTSPSVTEHELGHNLGVWHAGQYYCTGALSGSCLSDYGDPTDVMGSGGSRHYNAEHKYMMGWIPPAEVASINTGTQTFNLTSLENPLVAGSTELIHARATDGTLFAIDRRSSVGYDTGLSGVYVHIVAHVNTDDTEIMSNSHVVPGTPFVDSVHHVTISTLSDSGATASVQVCIGTCGSSPTTTTSSSTTTSTSSTTTTTRPPGTTTTTTRPPGTTTTTTRPPGTTTTTTAVPPGPNNVSARNIATGYKSQSGNTSISLTVPSGGGAAAGHTVVVSTSASSVRGDVSCRDSRGNVYTLDVNSFGSSRLIVCSAYVTNALQPGDTITTSYPGFSGVTVSTANDFTGIKASARVDKTKENAGNNGTVDSGSTATTAQATEVVFGVEIHGSSSNFVPSAGYTVVGSYIYGIGSGRKVITPFFKVVSATGAFKADGVLSPGQQWRAAVVTYER